MKRISTLSISKLAYTDLLRLSACIILMLFYTNLSHAQENKTVTISARIIRDASYLPIGFAHIKNINRAYGTIADSLGWFNLHIGCHDTLRISALGYESIEFFLPDSLLDSPATIQTIKLRQRTYMLGEVEVLPYTWEQFKRAIINAPITNEKYINQDLLTLPNDELAAIQLLGNQGIAFEIPSKRSRSLAKRNTLIRQAAIDAKIDKKFNVSLLYEITGIEDEDTLIRFIDFCNFSRSFLLNGIEYDIIRAIEIKYGLFKDK